MLKIYYDAYQEGVWFSQLHSALANSVLLPFPSVRYTPTSLAKVLAYDRPDIVLTDRDEPILVVERTVEVPSGHNVGQRFARLVAAAQNGVPAVYFGPYAAFKHGGETSGARYMNLRLFYALDVVMQVEGSPITTICWPVDSEFEIIQDPSKDDRLRDYLAFFFAERERDVTTVGESILESEFERLQEQERRKFAGTLVRARGYDGPPPSVVFGPPSLFGIPAREGEKLTPEVLFYRVGMHYIRSDPYTGTGMLYAYLYCGGLANRSRSLILSFPYISQATWLEAARRGHETKTIRIFRLIADGIVFSDGYLSKARL